MKIPLLSALAVGTVSLLTWGGISANNQYQHQKKMEKYAQYWEEFSKKVLESSDLQKDICSSADNCETNKSYLPKPDEHEYWSEVYKSLEANNKAEPKTAKLTHIKSPDQLMDYCYLKVEEELPKNLKDTNSSSGWFTDCAYDPKT